MFTHTHTHTHTYTHSFHVKLILERDFTIYLSTGFVRSKDGKPIARANVVVEGINHNVTTTADGEYWRLLLPGTYSVYATSWGYVIFKC